MFLLRSLVGGEVAATFHCGGEVVTIGRDESNDVVLHRPGVSRAHAAIRHGAGRFVVEDLGATNGVLVNGRRVEKAALSHGDVIEVGSARLEFSTHLAAPTGAEAAVEPVAEPARYVALPGSPVYHRDDCASVAHSPKWRLVSFRVARHAREAGLRPCRRCLS